MDELLKIGDKLETVEQLPADREKKFKAPGGVDLPRIPPAAGNLPIQGLYPEWVVVLPGLLFSHGGFTADPLREWLAVNEQHRPLCRIETSGSVFRGAYDPADRYVVACRRDAWPSLSNYLGSLKAVDPRDENRKSEAFLHRAILRPANVSDAWFSDWKKAVRVKVVTPGISMPVPVIPWVVGVTTAQGDWYIDCDRHPKVRLSKRDVRRS